MMKEHHQLWVRLAGLGVLIALSAAAYYANPIFFQNIGELLIKGDIVGSIDFLQSYGPYAMAISFFLIVFINVTAVLPNIFILAANGIIFGVFWGTIVSWLAEVVGVILSFIIMRYLFHDAAHNLIVRSNSLKRVDEFSGKKGFRIMLVARSIPYIPSGLLTALGAVSSISLGDYSLATLIGKLPSAWIEVTLGHDLMSLHEHTLRLTILIVISCLAYYTFVKYKNQGTEKK